MSSSTSELREETSRTLRGPEPLHYHRAGEGHGLLLVHGSGPRVSGWANFGPNVPVFSRDHTVIIPDRRASVRVTVPT